MHQSYFDIFTPLNIDGKDAVFSISMDLTKVSAPVVVYIHKIRRVDTIIRSSKYGFVEAYS